MNTTDLSNHSDRKRSTKRNAILGTTAGVLGGGAIGLLMVAPSLTSAASVNEPAAAVALQEDTTDDTVTDDTVTDDTVRPEPGEQLRAVLQDLVDDGTITSAQADAVAEHLVANRPERGDRGPGGNMGPGRRGPGGAMGPGGDVGVLAEVLGVDADTLREELRAGSSIADIATANGVEVQAVIDALIDEAQTHLDQAVENGRLTDDEAATKLAELSERVAARVNGERPGRG